MTRHGLILIGYPPRNTAPLFSVGPATRGVRPSFAAKRTASELVRLRAGVEQPEEVRLDRRGWKPPMRVQGVEHDVRRAHPKDRLDRVDDVRRRRGGRQTEGLLSATPEMLRARQA